MHPGCGASEVMNQSEEKWGHRRQAPPTSKEVTKFDTMMAEVDDAAPDDSSDAKALDARFTKQLHLARAAIRDNCGDSDDGNDGSDDEVTTARVAHAKEGSFDVYRTTLPEISVDLNALRNFVTRAPAKGNKAVQCYVERDKSGVHMMRPVYRLFLEDGKQFLLGAQKRIKNKTSNYLLSMDRCPTDRRSGLIVGKLRGNWSGASYTMYDQGLNPSKTSLASNVRCILGVVDFTYDKMGPGRMAIRIPSVNAAGVATPLKDKGGADDAKGSNDGGDDDDDLLVVKLRNKRPKYDEKARGHVLNFNGRVTMSSVKNFQLQCDGDANADVVMQFGRVSCQPPGPNEQCSCHKHMFNLDYKHPLSAVQAFAVCLATMDGKLADNKTFDALSELAKRK
ncbi:hypothetical protein H310_02931 [Aphanomyces invadans]|uniref:Tubby C-terminal domain-containing protein n=1 Tax=Aphanomyces invadans TaxID=157072 RepID=A0A024UMC1_9STRA|nr:hypothetical protein H310_02931 [Aphanomyces invadans]ETW06773.1 hypothetical protein H310_02931 [Aphanomyces invadans]|eukprot:XP_008864848.1 hypothetical protein H310_02931 [Aphanomyces invadans]